MTALRVAQGGEDFFVRDRVVGGFVEQDVGTGRATRVAKNEEIGTFSA